MSGTRVGKVENLYRYPVKSMLGESLDQVALLSGGVQGDRAIALIDDETGKIVTAKQPRLWKAMLELQTESHADGSTVVVFPDGRRLDMTAGDAGDVMSEFLGRAVSVSSTRPEYIEMERANPDQVIAEGSGKAVDYDVLPLGMGAPSSAFVDYGPVHLIATSSLRAAGEHSAAKKPDAQRFRPNIIIETDKLATFCENAWIGGVLKIGAKVQLKVMLPTPRCAVPTLEHGKTAADKTILAYLVRENTQPFLDKGELPSLGVYAEVLRVGDVACGDDVVFVAD